MLATISFALSFAAWGLVGGLASVFAELYGLAASETALLVAVPVLLGSLARLPMGMRTDRVGSRFMFTLLMVVSAIAAWLVPATNSYHSLLLAAFFLGLAGSSFAIGAAFVSRLTARARQETALGIYGLGTIGQTLAAQRRGLQGRRTTRTTRLPGPTSLGAVEFDLVTESSRRCSGQRTRTMRRTAVNPGASSRYR